ncbi:MAG TPA: HAD family acid phosphatase [Steroidobacteraceae bacterium]|jgi:5'-nucleotidase (lipoprotein e(P4) family)|nr:HAD family acid phosphatase [Steroidobacteraceae bacterium]
MLRGVASAVGCFIACTITCAASAEDLTGREALHATLWMQVSPEYRAIVTQVYKLAEERIAVASTGTAALEQSGVPADALARLPTAVVLDLDETVLDNTVYQARLLRDRTVYSARSWGEWVGAGEAEALPGAREFIAHARRLGHTVFYITNRDCTTPAPTATDPCPAKTATMRNLVALGIDPAPDPERMLLRGERSEWSNSNKTLRRAFIAANYRIVALVGDDLGDFVDPQVYAGDRQRLEPRFGKSWFVLPNPIYGSWTKGFDTIDEKYAALHTADVALELPGGGRWQGNETRVRIASWNVEYLVTPETHLALRATCAENGGMVGGDDRTLPCAITKHEPRTPDDYASLRRYATELRADIVALQEVDGPEAAAQVFPGYDYCFSTRAHTQKNGFAIRRGLPHRCEPEYEPLSLDNAVRRGVVVTFFPGTTDEFQLMSVHLKSGCPAGPLTAPGRNCELLSRQVAPLEAWIEGEANAGHRFGLLGDFNRRFTIEKGPARDAQGRQLNVYAEIDDGIPAASKLTNITGAAKFTPCTTDSEYREYIDNILLGRDLAKDVVKKSFVRVVFNDADAKAHWLSDHCPVGIELRLR